MNQIPYTRWSTVEVEDRNASGIPLLPYFVRSGANLAQGELKATPPSPSRVLRLSFLVLCQELVP